MTSNGRQAQGGTAFRRISPKRRAPTEQVIIDK